MDTCIRYTRKGLTPVMEAPLTVTQLNTRVKGMFQSSPGLNDIWVNGEISNLTRATSGHYYFTLKDEGSEIRCAMFARSRSRIDLEPKENMKVSVFGGVDIYIQRGSYQFIVQSMRQSGLGDLYVRFEELKKKLSAEGLFDVGRKKPLPKYPRTIGVVTSETGAVIHDIITTSASRFPADILLAPAQVQGEAAAATIIAGIRLLDRIGVDVIIVGRGGGSIEDLWPFNEESVARAIAECRTPVVSAVGHETDFTIADFVADVRAPTPTGAAAIILRDRNEIRTQIDREMANADRALGTVVERMRSRFDVLDAKLSPQSALRDIDMRSMGVDDLWSRADRALSDTVRSMDSRFRVVEARLSPASALRDIESRRSKVDTLYSRLSPDSALKDIGIRGNRLDSAFMRISTAGGTAMQTCRARLDKASARLDSLNPTAVLDRGYGFIVAPDGRTVDSVKSLLVGETVDIRLKDGTAKVAVKQIEEFK